MFILKERIALLTAENEQLKSQQLVKAETGECHKYLLSYDYDLILCLDLTDEEKSLTPQIKTEFKEEAATVTKSQSESTGTAIIKFG